MIRNLIRKKFFENLRPCSRRQFSIDENKKSDGAETEKKEDKDSEDSFVLPEPPENCCMSGCEKCVWIQYAKELTDLYKDSGETARKIIMKKIQDPTMQVFLKMELSSLK